MPPPGPVLLFNPFGFFSSTVHHKHDEVAIFQLDPDTEQLSFLWPLRLRKSGHIPLCSNESLAARSSRERRAFLNNHFATVTHSSIFENFKLSQDAPSRPHPIQKIISAPLEINGQVKGVIQVSRKGVDSNQAGHDFCSNELEALVAAAGVLARQL